MHAEFEIKQRASQMLEGVLYAVATWPSRKPAPGTDQFSLRRWTPRRQVWQYAIGARTGSTLVQVHWYRQRVSNMACALDKNEQGLGVVAVEVEVVVQGNA